MVPGKRIWALDSEKTTVNKILRGYDRLWVPEFETLPRFDAEFQLGRVTDCGGRVKEEESFDGLQRAGPGLHLWVSVYTGGRVKRLWGPN